MKFSSIFFPCAIFPSFSTCAIFTCNFYLCHFYLSFLPVIFTCAIFTYAIFACAIFACAIFACAIFTFAIIITYKRRNANLPKPRKHMKNRPINLNGPQLGLQQSAGPHPLLISSPWSCKERKSNYWYYFTSSP